jgi:hypothetical protein
VSVKPPSVARETRAVAIALLQIVFWSAVTINAARTSTANPAAGLQADEIAFGKLDADEQRLFRRALEGLAEAEDVRSATGKWPTIEELAARGIPPFASDPIDHYNYRWKMIRDRYVVNYIGIPGWVDRPTFVIAGVEPEPGAAELAEVDETHHKLADGTLIHVGVYRGTIRNVPPGPLSQFPFIDGWRRIVAVTR